MTTDCDIFDKISLPTFVYPICLIILLILSIISIKQLPSRERIRTLIKITYFIALTFSIIYNVSSTIMEFTRITCNDIQPHIGFISVTSYSCVNLSVATMLLLRLYFTFKESIYEISPCQKWFFIISFLIMILSSIANTIAYFIINIPMSLISQGVGALFYFISSIYGMILFAKKMYTLTKLRASSMRSSMSGTYRRSTVFNAAQKKMLYTTTKYVTLLSLAMIWTWITWIMIGVGLVLSGDMFLYLICSVNIDCVINILSLYLQYPFNGKYYDKYCICFSKCCTYVLRKRAMKAIGKNVELTPANSYAPPIMDIIIEDGLEMQQSHENVV